MGRGRGRSCDCLLWRWRRQWHRIPVDRLIDRFGLMGGRMRVRLRGYRPPLGRARVMARRVSRWGWSVVGRGSVQPVSRPRQVRRRRVGTLVVFLLVVVATKESVPRLLELWCAERERRQGRERDERSLHHKEVGSGCPFEKKMKKTILKKGGTFWKPPRGKEKHGRL